MLLSDILSKGGGSQQMSPATSKNNILGFEVQESFPGLGGEWVWTDATVTPSALWGSWQNPFDKMEVGKQWCFSYQVFGEKLLVRVEEGFSVKSIQIPKVPRKVCFFTWLAARRVILTTKNLRKTKVICISWYNLCNEVGRKRRWSSATL